MSNKGILELNTGSNIPDNIPKISATFFSKNSVIYKREYPLDVTFGDILTDFEKNIQDEELKSKIEYSYKKRKIKKEDKVLDIVTPSPGAKLVEVEIGLDMSNIDLPEPNDKTLAFKTIIIPQGESAENDNSNSKPFRLIVYKPEEGRITMEKYPKEKNVQYALNSYCDNSSAFCNSNDALYMSGGEKEKKPTKDFWKISHNRDVLDYKQMPCCKKNHSMIYIPNNCVFMVGGNSKNTFYYDTKKDIFCKWAELNEPVDKPALVFVDNRYLYSFPSDSCEFERSDLKASPSWEKVNPIMKDGTQFNLKNYNVGTDKYGNIILYGGDNEDDESGYYYVYDPKNNEMEQSIGFNSYVVSNDKQFYPINNYNSVLFPKNFEDDNSIYVMKKNGNVQPFKFNIEQNEKNTKDYIDYKDPAKEIDGKLIIKTREEAIPITNDVELMKKQKNKQPIDYSALSPYLKGIIKGLKDKEELKKKEEEAAKPEEVGDDIIIDNDDQFGKITDPENPTVLKSKSKWTKPRNIVKLGIPRLAKRSKELEPIKEPVKERENVKIEEMEKIETDVEPKKEQEEEDKPIQKKKKNDLSIPNSAYGNNIKREIDDTEEPFDVDNNIQNVKENKKYRKGETLPLKRPEFDLTKKNASNEIVEASDDDEDDFNKKKVGLRDVKTVDDNKNKNNIEEPDYDIDVDNDTDKNVETDNQNYEININNRPLFLKEIISKSPDDDIILNIKKLTPDNINVYDLEGVIPGEKGKDDLINPEIEVRENEKPNIHNPDYSYELSGEIPGVKKPEEKDNNSINITGKFPGVVIPKNKGNVNINIEESEINVKPPNIQTNIHKTDEGSEFDDSIFSGEIKGIKKPGLITQKPNKNNNTETININAPKIDVNIKKPEVDYGISGEIPGVKKPEAKIDINPPKVEIPKQKVEINAPKIDMNVKKPEVDYGISGEIPGVKKPEAKININPPKVEIPKQKVEINAPKIDMNVKKPEAKININPPKVEIPKQKVEINAPKIDMNVKKPEAKININPPKVEIPKQKVEIKQQEVEANLDISGDVPKIETNIKPTLKKGGKDSGRINIDAPKIDIKTEPAKVKIEPPKVKIPEVKTEIKTEPQKIKVPEIKSNKNKSEIINLEYEKPSIPNFSGGKDFINPYGEIETKDSFKKGKMSLTIPKEDTSPRSQKEYRNSLVKPKEKKSADVKVIAPRISLKPNQKNSGNTSLDFDNGNIVKNIQVPRLTKRMEKSFSNSSDLDYDGDVNNLKLSKGIGVDGSGLLTLTQLMSLDVNAPINLDGNWIREKKWNKYGGYEIGVPDYHLVYENRGNEGDNNINIEGSDININEGKVNVKGGKYGISGEGVDVDDIGFNYNLDAEGGDYNIEVDHMGYSQPMNFDVEIPEDLNVIPNSKVKTRVHKPKPRDKPSINAFEYDEEGKIKNSLKVTLPPSKTDEAYVMNYLTLPPFHYTITQAPKENIPLCNEWFYHEIELDNLADYDPK